MVKKQRPVPVFKKNFRHPILFSRKLIFNDHNFQYRSLKVVDSCWTFWTELSDTFRSCFVYGKEQES